MLANELSGIHWRNAEFMYSAAGHDQFYDGPLLQVAVAGHSNVGKSSLLNALFEQRGICKVSKAPGCTQLLNLFQVDEKLIVVDMPGYGFARKSKAEKKKWARLADDFFMSEQRPKMVVVLMDIRHGPKPHDMELVRWLNDLEMRWLAVATKADKLSRQQQGKRLVEMSQTLGGFQPIPTSAKSGLGMDTLKSSMIASLVS